MDGLTDSATAQPCVARVRLVPTALVDGRANGEDLGLVAATGPEGLPWCHALKHSVVSRGPPVVSLGAHLVGIIQGQ